MGEGRIAAGKHGGGGGADELEGGGHVNRQAATDGGGEVKLADARLVSDRVEVFGGGEDDTEDLGLVEEREIGKRILKPATEFGPNGLVGEDESDAAIKTVLAEP